MRGPDPIEDFDRYDMECADEDSFYPHCTLCKKTITSDYYKTVRIKGVDYILCDDCLEEESTENYIEKERERRWTSRQG